MIFLELWQLLYRTDCIYLVLYSYLDICCVLGFVVVVDVGDVQGDLALVHVVGRVSSSAAGVVLGGSKVVVDALVVAEIAGVVLVADVDSTPAANI